MSVRAYRITKFEFAEESTFNLWYHKKLMELLDPYIPEWFSADGGYLEFSQEELEDALAAATKQRAGEETITILKEMLRHATESENGWVRYWCV
jgi:hypothetical protein